MPAASLRATTRELAAVLSGTGAVRADCDDDAWLALASRHRVDILLAERLSRDVGRGAASNPVALELQRRRREAVLLETVRHTECTRVLAELSAAGIQVVVMKGGALAYQLYAQPYVRPRGDTDILISKRDLPATVHAFERLGYRRAVETSGELVTHQWHFDRIDRAGVNHAWDVHWKIVNRHVAADALTHEELCREGVPHPAFDATVLAPSLAASMLLACVHRVLHHADSPDLLWLMDIHLLAGRLSDEEWIAWIARARDRHVWSACARSLARTRHAFGTPLPPMAARAIAEDPGDATAGFGDPGLRQIDILRADLAALPSWRSRWRLLNDHVFPPAEFIQARYGVCARAALPWWYLRRVWAGAPRWFRRLRPAPQTDAGR